MEGTEFGQYRLLTLLGRGGMGEVWRAHDTATDRVVALKVLPPHLASDENFKMRFRREARAAAGLYEPHVVPIHSYGEIDGRLYVDMRLIVGQDLDTMIGPGPLDPSRSVKIIDQVASALQAAHEVGLVHRDVKPSNILVAQSDFAYLIDFGIARVVGSTGLTTTGSMIGTWAYMAPERFRSGEPDPRSDVYALACVLHECLTGQRPFPGDSVEQQVAGHLSTPPPEPSKMNTDVPPAFDEVVAIGMAKNAGERYATTIELAAAALAATSMLKPPPPLPTVAITAARLQPASRASTEQQFPLAVSPSDSTQIRQPGGLQGQPPPSDHSLEPVSEKRTLFRVLAITGSAALVVIAVVAGIVLSRSDHSAPPSTTQATADTGPLTGSFDVAFEPGIRDNGTPSTAQANAFTETWHLRSACGTNGCVASAQTGVASAYFAQNLVFDEVDGRWLAVNTTPGGCKGSGAEQWDVISIEPQTGGSLVGDWTRWHSDGCYFQRRVTFTRTGDTDISQLLDPARVDPRVTSPAEALRGSYDYELRYTTGSVSRYTVRARTDCLRTGFQCVSNFVDREKDFGQLFLFQNGVWTRDEEDDVACSKGGTQQLRLTATLALPAPPEDPIGKIEGSGHMESTGSVCVSKDYEMVFTRTGD